jgi:hypothetical protein
VKSGSGSARRWFVAVAVLWVAGCAQSTGSGKSAGDKVPEYVPSDRWHASAALKTAGISAADRNASLILACEERGGTITLLVSPQRKLPIDYSYRPVTIILNRHITYIQNWVSLADGYSIHSADPGFRTTIEELQKHDEVEFVLGRPGTDIDDRSFSLNGAREAIDAVLAACGRPW